MKKRSKVPNMDTQNEKFHVWLDDHCKELNAEAASAFELVAKKATATALCFRAGRQVASQQGISATKQALSQALHLLAKRTMDYDHALRKT